ncbi:probable glutamate receptor [Portunus trituberculatus]|uniref:probable glutamate receptor n=1 Tax=Portunus trituberculatus TaxID=210409 RepID=UPI001E1CDC4E|nr:probable glutamate receptor [Portunus trituberculatus]
MEIVPEVEGGAFTLYEMWSPGGSVGLKSGLAGIWTSNSDFQGRTASYPWTLATARLRLYPQALYERRSDLTGVHFIVTSINDTRAQKSHFDKTLGREVLTGYFGDVWELFKTEMNFTYSVTTPSDGEFGSLTKGRWTGLIGDVLSGQAHVIVAQLSQTYSRAQVIDYSSVLIKFSYRIFARPQARSAVSWSSYTRPFSQSLWIGLGLTIVILGVIFCCIAHWYLHQEMQNTKVLTERRIDWLTNNGEVMKYRLWKKDSFLLMWAAFTQQGWPDPPEPDSLHILFWIVYMMGVVVVAAYSATLVSFLTVIDEGLPFESLTDLKQLRTYRLGILKGSVLEELFQSQGFQEYWNALIEPYSDTLATSYDELRSLASRDPDFAYVGSYEIQKLDPVGACIFHSARQHLLFNDGALGWPKGSPYTGIFDFHIIRLRESGVLHKLSRKWYPEAYSCVNSPVMPLGFQQVFTAFVALGLGAGLSILFLSGEKMFFQKTAYNDRSQVRKEKLPQLLLKV